MMAQQDGGLVSDGQGRLSWWHPAPAAVAAGILSPAPGVVVAVDLTDPRRVLSWSVPGPDALDALAALFGSSWLHAVRAAADPLPAAVPAPPPLAGAWARLGLAAGVQRWMPAPLPEVTLGLDQALAWHEAGLEEQARAEFAAGSAALLYRAEACLDGDLPTAMRPGLRAAASAAAALLGAEQHPDTAALTRLAAELTAAGDLPAAGAGLRDTVLTALLGAATPAVHAGDAGTAAPETMAAERVDPALVPARVLGRVDPALVPARILAWTGAETPELLVETHTDPHRLRVSAALAPGTEPGDREVTELIARAVDPARGTVCGSGVFVPADDTPAGDGHRIIADLLLLGPPPAALRVQVYQAGRPGPFLRTIRDPELIRADRLMLEAWMLHRLAGATRALGDASSGRAARTLLYRAVDSAKGALAALNRLTAAHPAGTGPPGRESTGEAPLLAGLRLAAGRPGPADLPARGAAIRGYLAALRAALPGEPGTGPDPVTAPLLAELELLATGTAP
jgi:hypothetical protein